MNKTLLVVLDDDVKLVHDNIVPVAWVVFVRFAIIENLGVHSVCEAYEEASDTVGNITSLR